MTNVMVIKTVGIVIIVIVVVRQVKLLLNLIDKRFELKPASPVESEDCLLVDDDVRRNFESRVVASAAPPGRRCAGPLPPARVAVSV